MQAAAPRPGSASRELARLRAEAQQLRQQTNELARARQQIQTLNQRMASDGGKGVRGGGQEEPGAAFEAETEKTQHMNACINNLRLY